MSLLVFLTALSVFAYQIAITKILGFVLSPFMAYASLGLALLGDALAGALMSLERFRQPARNPRARLFWLSIAMCLSILLSFRCVALIQDWMNARVETLPYPGLSLAATLNVLRHEVPPLVALVTLAPYLIGGWMLLTVYVSEKRESYSRLYLWSSVGAATGCWLSYCLLESGLFTWAQLLGPLAALVVAVAIRRERALSLAAAMGLLILLVGLFRSSFEPAPNLSFLAGENESASHIVESWRTWNSTTRVSHLSITRNNGSTTQVTAIGNADSRGSLIAYPQEPSTAERWYTIDLALALGTPSSILIPFAGAAPEMILLDSATRGQSQITGVEINRALIDHAMSLPSLRLRDFFAQSNIRFVRDEARSFLAREPGRYDLIFVPWSGGGGEIYPGLIGTTSQYFFTRQAFADLFRHLTPNGQIALFEGDKAILQITAENALRALGRESKNAFLVLTKIGTDPNSIAKGAAERIGKILFIRPGGYSEADLARIGTRARAHGFEIGHFDPQTLAGLEPLTDDRPQFSESASPSEQVQKMIEGHPVYFKFFAYLLVLAGIILGASYSSARRHEEGGALLRTFAFFTALGAGFASIQVGLIQKLFLPLGSSGLALTVAISSFLAFAGLGARFARRIFGDSTFHACVGAVLALSALVIASGDLMVVDLLSLSMAKKILLATLGTGLFAFPMGYLFPAALQHWGDRSRGLIAWIWVVDGLAAVIAATLAPILTIRFGARTVLIVGALCYLALLLQGKDFFLPKSNRSDGTADI